MKFLSRTFLILLLLTPIIRIEAQELKCRININRSQIQGTNEELFRSMNRDLYEFMNNRKWTRHVYTNNERIECQIQINLSEYNGIDKFKGNISVQSTRPIYNTNYKSTLLNFKESADFEFTYTEGQAMEFNENTHISNLTSVLAFYAYVIIGIDYDSFGMLSGTEYFQKAKQILDNAQSDPDPNWRAFGTRNQQNRYYLIEALNSERNAPMRRFYYKYHRLGLDKMEDNAEQARTEIENSLKYLQTTFKQDRESYFLRITLVAKDNEFVKIFSEAPVPEKMRVYNLLKSIDPINKNFDKLKESSRN